MSKYPIIVFEGIEGSGKSFHIKSVEKYFKIKRIKYIKLREPGGSSNSEKIRNLILNKDSNFHKLTDLLLYLGSRNENYHLLLKKNYKKKVIIIDRFIDSTIAYQHYGMGIDKKLINLLNKLILHGIRPNFTFLHLVSMKNLRTRINKRKKNRYDYFQNKFYERVQCGYKKIAGKKNNYLIIDSNNQITENKKIILQKIKKLL